MMAKRFVSTELFEDSFFMELSPELKLFWIYLITKCNHAGIWQVNKKLAEFHIGAKLDWERMKEVFKDKIIMRDNVWYIPNFIYYQYGSSLNPSNKVHNSVIRLLDEEGFTDTTEISESPEPTLEEVIKYFSSLGFPKTEAENFYSYYSAQNWETKSGVSIKKRWQNKVIGFVNNSKSFSNAPKPEQQPAPVFSVKGVCEICGNPNIITSDNISACSYDHILKIKERRKNESKNK